MALQATATRPEAWGWHLLGLINPVVVIAGNLLGGPFVTAGVIYMLGIGPMLDVCFAAASFARFRATI